MPEWKDSLVDENEDLNIEKEDIQDACDETKFG